MRWTQRIPLWLFALITLPLALAPWPLKPSVHLWEQVHLLILNSPGAPADLFDIVLHATPGALFMFKVSETLYHRLYAKPIQANV